MSRKKNLISELDLQKIGGRIAYIRLINEETQAVFCEKTGLSKGNLSELEKNKYDPSYQAIIKIVDIYNINPGWLLFGKGDPFVIEDKKPQIELVSDPIIEEHFEIVKKFKNKDRAKKINEHLLQIDDQYSEKLKIVEFILQGMASGLSFKFEVVENNASSNYFGRSEGKLKNGTEE